MEIFTIECILNPYFRTSNRSPALRHHIHSGYLPCHPNALLPSPSAHHQPAALAYLFLSSLLDQVHASHPSLPNLHGKVAHLSCSNLRPTFAPSTRHTDQGTWSQSTHVNS